MNILISVLLAVDMIVAVLMTFVILMQRPKSEGLGAAFGGGVTENIFGAQTTNVLVKFTGWLAGIFFVLTFVLGVLYAQRGSSDSALHKELMGMPTPAAAATASPAPVTGSPAATAAPNAATSPAGNVSPAATAKPLDATVAASIAPSSSAVPSASP
jgi:preprotein translocase subunit SecG